VTSGERLPRVRSQEAGVIGRLIHRLIERRLGEGAGVAPDAAGAVKNFRNDALDKASRLSLRPCGVAVACSD
jgi:hypothetical protein